jgi:Plasmid pRiA4b ORF-3-like protein
LAGSEQKSRWLQDPNEKLPKCETEGIAVLNRWVQKNTGWGKVPLTCRMIHSVSRTLIMYLSSSELPQVLPEHKKILQNLAIDAHGPGTILRDFETLLGLLKEKDGLAITPSGQLSLNILEDINARLAHPIHVNLKRPQQKSYRPIQGLYLLLRASGLTYVGGTGPKPRLLLDEVAYHQWLKLNPTERYGTLLETWILHGKPEIVGERWNRLELIPENIGQSAAFYFRIPPTGMPIADNRDNAYQLSYIPGWHNLGLLALFGLIHIEEGTAEPGQGWQIKTIKRTPLGDALMIVLYRYFLENLSPIFQMDDDDAIQTAFNSLQPLLQPYFPAWKHSLTASAWVYRDGTYTFKVALGSVWRRIAIGAKSTLDDLASMILNAYDFDFDHLYEFSYRNRFGAREAVLHPYSDEGPYGSEIQIGEVPIAIGQSMTFLYDFGDNWKFTVILEQVESEKVTPKPSILESHGKPPEQYPSWDE